MENSAGWNLNFIKARLCWLAVLLIMTTLAALGQQQIDVPKTAEQLQVIKVEPGESISVPFRAGMPGVVTPIKCSSGKVFVRVAGTDASLSLIAISLKDKSVVEFNVPILPELSSMRLGTFFVSESDLYAIITGTIETNHKPADAPSVEPDENHYYLARFGFDGQLRKLLKLDLPFRPVQVGVFPSGTLVAAGIDNVGNPQVGFLKADGRLDRYIEMPDLSAESKGVKDFAQNQFNGYAKGALAWAIGVSDFIPFQGHLLFVLRQTSSTVYDISPSLQVRKIELHLPPGSRLSALVTGKEFWTGQLTTKVEKQQGLTISYVNFDPETGVAKEKITSAAPLGMGLACINDGIPTIIKREQDGTFVLVHTRRAP